MGQERVDLISNLPHDILNRISAFLPLKEAVRTSVLSTKWRSLWIPTDRLANHFAITVGDGDGEDGSTAVTNAVKDSLEAINTFLGSYESPEIRKLCVRYPRAGDMVILAAKGVNKKLHLDFSQSKGFLEENNLYYTLRMEPAGLMTAINTVNSAKLKTLHLRSVAGVTAGSFASSLLSNCQNLEKLKVEKCSGLKSIEIENNESLKSLVVANCPEVERLTVCATSLRSFRYEGLLTQIQMTSTASLVDVALDLEGTRDQSEFDCEEVISLLASIKEVESLTISGWLLESLCSAGVNFGRLEFQFNELKELKWIGALMDSAKRDSLACFFNTCPVLEKLILSIDDSRIPIKCPHFHQHWHEPHLWLDYPTMKSNTPQLKHLKSVEFSGFSISGGVGEGFLMSLVDLLLEKTLTLESMVITSPQKATWRVEKVLEERPKKQRWWWSFRKGAEVSFPRTSYPFVFVEERAEVK